MAYTKLGTVSWGTQPTNPITISYDYQRSGSDMQYKIKVSVAPCDGASWYGYPIYAAISLDGTQKATKTLKSASPSQWSSDIVYETGWLTVSKKTSGTTALKVRIYSGSGSSRDATYSYNLTVSPATSVLGTISAFTLGNAINIPITKYSSSFTDTLVISLNGTTIKTVAGIINGDDITFTASELTAIYKLLPSATTGSFTFKLTTKNGSTVVGSSSKTATGTIPTSVKPTISSVVVSEGNTSVVPSGWGIFVENKSKLKFVISASAGSGSGVSTVKTTINGKTYTGSTITTDLINASGNLTATIVVTDNRGRTASTTKQITIVDYDVPYVTEFSAVRCLEDGTESNSGTFAKVILRGGVYSLSGKNTPFSYVIQYKKTSEDEYNTYTFDVNEPTINASVILDGIETISSYNIKAIITDYFTNTPISIPPLLSAFRTMNWKKGGKGVGIGKIAEEEGLLDIGFETRLFGGLKPVFLEGETDLNTVLNCGWYTGENVKSYNYANCPLDDGTFFLEVMSCGESGQRKQRIVSCSKTDAVTFERFYYSSTWGEWVRVSDFGNSLLWSGGYYMTSGHTVTLGEVVSKQANGIILVFSEFINDAVSNTAFHCRFIPKMLVSKHGGVGQCIQLSSSNLDYFATKYLYIYDNKIVGHDNNGMTGTGDCGINFTNTRFVLRYVIGV